MQIDSSLQSQSVLRRLFIENVDEQKVVMLTAGDELRTCNPLACLLRLRQASDASKYAAALLNCARKLNDKPRVEIEPVVTVRDWNLIIASALSEQVEARRFLS
jgi:hypothetical protein